MSFNPIPIPIDSIPPCSEFADFEKYLRESRKFDDNIIFLLNKTDGSADQCANLWKQMYNSYNQREGAINSCIKEFEGMLLIVSTEIHRKTSDKCPRKTHKINP